MSLQKIIADIQRNLKSGSYPNEDEITRKVVMRLLSELGWDIYGRQTRGQYAVKSGPDKNGRVDVALLANESDPDIFVEVKQHGSLQGSDAVTQVFNYAWHDNVPFLIVTDGQEWNFYLSRVGRGSDYENRKVCSLDLIKNDITESEYQLQRYLSHKEVAKGNALRNAQLDHQSVTNMRKAVNAVPIAWQQLLEEKGTVMLKLLSKKVENICGCRPDPEMLRSYLRGLKASQIQSQPYSPPVKVRQAKISQPMKERRKSSTTIKVILPNGKEIYNKKAVTTLVETIRAIGYDKVRSLEINCKGFPFVSTERNMKRHDEWKDTGDGYFIHIKSSTENKKKRLNEISNRLNLGLQVTIVTAI